jgi:hypothetical protein
VEPATWKNKLGLIEATKIKIGKRKLKPAQKSAIKKDEARLLAIKLFPEFAEEMKFKKDHNIAESLLIGYYYKKYIKDK